jgi:hypothetical protein
MTKVFSSVLLVAFASLAFAQEEKKDPKAVSASETVKKWIDAAANRDMKTLEKLAAKTTRKTSLKLIKEQWFINYQGTVKIIHEETSGDRAVVVYRLENRDAVFTPEICYDVIGLVREDNEWKVDDRVGGVLKPAKPLPKPPK